jgi:predicted RNA polymerase sigma factor
VTAAQTHAAIEAVVRMESARLIAGLARYTGDIGLAEELAQDAVVARWNSGRSPAFRATRAPG